MNKVIMFTLGATIGSLLTWKFIEEKYRKIADEEIEAVREYYKSREQKVEDIKQEYMEKLDHLGYMGEEIISIEEDDYEVQVEEVEEQIAPYLISPEEFGDQPGYDYREWTYYSDFVLTDDDDMIIGDPESIIGDALNHFGEYDDNSVFVRNENTKCDYEIIKYNRTFSEVNGSEN